MKMIPPSRGRHPGASPQSQRLCADTGPVVLTCRISLILLALLLIAVPRKASAVDTVPVPVNGTVRFSNTNLSLLPFLTMHYLGVYANSTAPARGSSIGLAATGALETDYQINADAQGAPPSGIDYQLAYALHLSGPPGPGGPVGYNITPGPRVTVRAGPALRAADVVECAGLFHLRFIDSTGAPVAVQGGSVSAFLTSGPVQSEVTLRAGTVEDHLAVRGDTGFRVRATIVAGSGDATLRFVLETNATSVCDHVIPIDFVVPAPTGLGAIRGELDMTGETEALWGDAGIGDPAYSRMLATGPLGNTRSNTLPLRTVSGGVMESSGNFMLPNLLPPNYTTPATAYTLQGGMGIRRFHDFEYFQTPALGVGLNPAPAVVPGSTLDLGRTFVMDPGFVDGRLEFTGPRETPGGTYISPLRGLIFSTDGSADGLPTRSIYGNFNSVVVATGMDVVAAGSTYSAVGGNAAVGFDGFYIAESGLWLGDYHLALAGLNGEASVWRPDGMGLRMVSGSVTNPDNYVNEGISITDQRIGNRVIVPGESTEINRNLAFGQVCIRFHSTGTPIWNPRLWLYSSGTGEGYSMDSIVANGTPNSPEAASDRGTLVLFLPQGRYHLVPFVSANPTDINASDYLQLDPFDIDVLALQQQCVTPCLRVEFDLPQCTSVSKFNIKGIVRTLCENKVRRATYHVDDGAEVELCSDCGVNPPLSFIVDLPGGDCSEHDITVSATDSNGEVASNTQHVHIDSKPPTISCPKDLVVDCTNSTGTVVVYPAPTVTDNCPGRVTVVCDPPSGSAFLPGVTIVRCVATDGCGNSAECKFTVTVNPNCPSIPCILTCPKDITADCTTPNGATVNYPAPILSGDCQKDAVITCTPPSGSFFPLGTNEVHCTAANADGKPFTDCKFFIIVRCPEPRDCRLTCPANRVVDCTEPLGAIVSFPAPVLGPDCSPGTHVECNPPSGSLFPFGVTIVTCKAVNEAGALVAECKFTVTVQSKLSIETATCVRWNCGRLQSAPDATGPWTDVVGATSPYYVSGLGSRWFYRVH